MTQETQSNGWTNDTNMTIDEVEKSSVRTFKPANAKQKGFIESRKQYVMLSGAVGAGKSFNGCWKGFILNLMYPGNKGLICRKEAKSLEHSTLWTLFNEVLTPDMIVSHNTFRGIIEHKTLVKGKTSFIIYSGLDKKAGQPYPTKIGSTQFGWIFADEGIELEEGDWMMLSTRLRHKIPGLNKKENDRVPRQMFTATNPDGPYHFLYKFFFGSKSKDREVFMTTPYDNPYLPADYLKKLEETLTGITRERLLNGKWAQAEGMIYSNFNPMKQVNNKGFLPLSEYKALVIGADSNYPLPRAAVLIGFRGDGNIDILDEFYKEGAPVQDLAKWCRGLTDMTKSTIYLFHDPSDPAAINELSTVPFLSCGKAYNKIIPGISAVARYFDQDKIRIDPGCTNLIRELQAYRWKPGKEKEEPLKKDDHAADSIRYGIATYMEGQGEVTILEDKDGIVF